METSTILLLINLFVIESLLSIDNAAVLAVMVQDLPVEQQPKALRYGMLGAFVFRGLCLFLASWLIKILWLKIAGGVYLLYLVYGHFKPKKETDQEEEIDKNKNWLYRFTHKTIGTFWSTVILIEIMDIVFSIDNIFAAIAMTDNFWIIFTGVCIGIVAMRFVAQWFSVLIRKYPSLENAAYYVIALLGIKLILLGTLDYIPGLHVVKEFMTSHTFDMLFTILMIIIFIPKKKLYGKRG